MVFSFSLNLIWFERKKYFGVGYPDIQWIIHIQSIDITGLVFSKIRLLGSRRTNGLFIVAVFANVATIYPGFLNPFTHFIHVSSKWITNPAKESWKLSLCRSVVMIRIGAAMGVMSKEISSHTRRIEIRKMDILWLIFALHSSLNVVLPMLLRTARPFVPQRSSTFPDMTTGVRKDLSANWSC